MSKCDFKTLTVEGLYEGTKIIESEKARIQVVCRKLLEAFKEYLKKEERGGVSPICKLSPVWSLRYDSGNMTVPTSYSFSLYYKGHEVMRKDSPEVLLADGLILPAGANLDSLHEAFLRNFPELIETLSPYYEAVDWKRSELSFG